jgi:hypothetical protein
MRRLLLPLLLTFALGVAAQDRPSNLQPLPEVPPPPAMAGESLEPQVTITKRGDDKVEEHRVNGKLYMIKVTPPNGTPYYMVDQKGDGSFARHEGHTDNLRVPQWVVGTF